MSITQPVYVFVALGTQLAVRLLRHLWPALLHNIFPHYLINGTIFEEKISHKYVFRVSVQLLFEMFFILRRTERDNDPKCGLVFCKVPLILVRF